MSTTHILCLKITYLLYLNMDILVKKIIKILRQNFVISMPEYDRTRWLCYHNKLIYSLQMISFNNLCLRNNQALNSSAT